MADQKETAQQQFDIKTPVNGYSIIEEVQSEIKPVHLASLLQLGQAQDDNRWTKDCLNSTQRRKTGEFELQQQIQELFLNNSQSNGEVGAEVVVQSQSRNNAGGHTALEVKVDADDRSPMSDVIKTYRSGRSHQHFGSTILLGKETIISENHQTQNSKVVGDGTKTAIQRASPIDFAEFIVNPKSTGHNRKRKKNKFNLRPETAKTGKNPRLGSSKLVENIQYKQIRSNLNELNIEQKKQPQRLVPQDSEQLKLAKNQLIPPQYVLQNRKILQNSFNSSSKPPKHFVRLHKGSTTGHRYMLNQIAEQLTFKSNEKRMTKTLNNDQQQLNEKISANDFNMPLKPLDQPLKKNLNVIGFGNFTVNDFKRNLAFRRSINKTATDIITDPTIETKKVNTSVQCGTQIEELDQNEYMISELGDARMTVSIQVTQQGKSARRPVRLQKNDDLRKSQDFKALLEEMNLTKKLFAHLPNEDEQSETNGGIQLSPMRRRQPGDLPQKLLFSSLRIPSTFLISNNIDSSIANNLNSDLPENLFNNPNGMHPMIIMQQMTSSSNQNPMTPESLSQDSHEYQQKLQQILSEPFRGNETTTLGQPQSDTEQADFSEKHITLGRSGSKQKFLRNSVSNRVPVVLNFAKMESIPSLNHILNRSASRPLPTTTKSSDTKGPIQKQRRLEKEHSAVQKAINLQNKRFQKEMDILIRKQNLEVITHSTTRLLNSVFDKKRFNRNKQRSLARDSKSNQRRFINDQVENLRQTAADDFSTQVLNDLTDKMHNGTGVLNSRQLNPSEHTSEQDVLLPRLDSFEQIGIKREINYGTTLDKSNDLMLQQSPSGLGEIFNSLKGKLYRKPQSCRAIAQVQTQKRVILGKLRDQLLSQRLTETQNANRKEEPSATPRTALNEVTIQTRGTDRVYLTEKNVFMKHKKHKSNFFSTSPANVTKFYEKYFVVQTEQAQHALKKQQAQNFQSTRINRELSLQDAERELFPQNLQTCKQ